MTVTMIRFGVSRFHQSVFLRGGGFSRINSSSSTLVINSLKVPFFVPEQQSANFCACSANYSSCSVISPSPGNTSRNLKRLSLTPANLIFHHGQFSPHRNLSSSLDKSQTTEGETNLTNTIRKCFPNATNISVEDISGGCGSMFSIFIEAPEFQGLSTVKQHLLVNNALKQEIKSMHGIRIQTAAPKK